MVHNRRMARWRAATSRSVVTEVDLRAAAAVCAVDPVGSVLAAARIESALVAGGVGGGSTVWGVETAGRLTAVCWAGANLVPVCEDGDEDALDAFADAALRQGRRCSSIVGSAWAVLGLWQRLEESWGPARDVRADQPSMIIDHGPLVQPDPAVRRGLPHEIDLVLPACIDMFIEEVGYSPVAGSPVAYEARVRQLLDDGRSFVRIDPGPSGPQVVFKAEIGAVSRAVAQVQGVWVPPERRGVGLAQRGMAAIVAQTLGRTAPVVSLYVNHYNTRAVHAYEAVGFRRVGTYATVLF